MTKYIPLLFLAAGLCAGLHAGEPVSLFDGKTLQGWTGQDGREPGAGWSVVEGTLQLDGAGGNSWEEHLAEILEQDPRVHSYVKNESWLGIEYQMLDDEKHPDSKNGPKRITASFYDIQAPTVKPPVKTPGEWNQSRVVVKDGKLQHWLNGVLVGEADTASPEWKANLAASKFKDKVGFAPGKGRIMLTDHKDKTSYRNIRIIEL